MHVHITYTCAEKSDTTESAQKWEMELLLQHLSNFPELAQGDSCSSIPSHRESTLLCFQLTKRSDGTPHCIFFIDSQFSSLINSLLRHNMKIDCLGRRHDNDKNNKNTYLFSTPEKDQLWSAGFTKLSTVYRLNESKAEEGKQGISTQEGCWTGNRWCNVANLST